jgi:hypothetical protein
VAVKSAIADSGKQTGDRITDKVTETGTMLLAGTQEAAGAVRTDVGDARKDLAEKIGETRTAVQVNITTSAVLRNRLDAALVDLFDIKRELSRSTNVSVSVSPSSPPAARPTPVEEVQTPRRVGELPTK